MSKHFFLFKNAIGRCFFTIIIFFKSSPTYSFYICSGLLIPVNLLQEVVIVWYCLKNNKTTFFKRLHGLNFKKKSKVLTRSQLKLKRTHKKKQKKNRHRCEYEKDWLLYFYGDILYNQRIEALTVKFRFNLIFACIYWDILSSQSQTKSPNINCTD